MKRFSASMLAATVLAGNCAWAGVAPSYVNYGNVTTPPVVDATSFVNLGILDFSEVSTATNLNLGIGLIPSGFPYSTRSTLYWTNENLMSAAPGFRFDYVTATSRTNAISFFNSGTITGVDTPGFPAAEFNGNNYITIPDASAPLPSQVLVYAKNIVNEGTIQVGSDGLVRMVGSNVNLANGALVAGSLSETDINDTTGQFGFNYGQANNIGFTVDPPQTYDLWWGATNGQTLFLPWFPPQQGNGLITGVRAGGFAAFLPVFGHSVSDFKSYVYEYIVGDPTNVYLNMMFINTNIVEQDGSQNTNVQISAGFAIGNPFPTDYVNPAPPPNGDFNGVEDVIQFSEPVEDVNGDTTVTNSIYFVDVGALLNPMTTNVNTQYTTGYSRPNEFQVYTAAPFGAQISAYTVGPNIPYDPSLIWADGDFMNQTVTTSNSSYGVQIGRNPEALDGLFTGAGFFGGLDLPDITNEPGRLEVIANNLNITNARFRAEGVVTLTGANMVGSPAASDWGNVNANLAAPKSTLLVSNLFPATFNRVRGDIYAYGVNWLNVFTNGVTNTIHYHVLIVDQDLHGRFSSSIRQLSLKATNIVITDTMRVIESDIFNTPALTINAPMTLTGEAGNFAPTNAVGLKNLLVGTNGSMDVDGVLDVGYPQAIGKTSPGNRTYSVLSITNFGTLAATAPLLQARSIENDGAITAAGGGSLVIYANTLGLSQGGINQTIQVFTNTYIVGQTNTIQAGGGISISAATIIASNSVIQSGLDGFGSLTLEATTLLTDNVPNTQTTNDVLVNFWQTTGGFSLLRQPAKGSLFGTQIKSIVSDHNVADHVWAGTDYGPTNTAFSKSLVIGRLVLDRLTTSGVMHFTGVGSKSAMYVDYLELDDASYTDYRNGLIIDPNLTIYFADSTADPIKLEQSFPGRLVWVPTFAGPNSTALVPFAGGGFCLVNAALAISPDISTAGNGIPNADTPIWATCPGSVTTMAIFAAQGTDTPASLALFVYGQGTVTPELKDKTGLVIGNSYSFTAKPDAGWLFDGWTGTYPTKSPTVSFTMQAAVTNVSLSANFILNPFPAVQGAYNGLFLTSDGVAADNSGFFNLTVNGNGVFSGSLRMGASTYSLSGQFNADGAASVTAKGTGGAPSLAVALQIDTAGQTGQVSGTVKAAQWTASLSGDRAPAWTARNPAPQQGTYTMLLAGQGNNLPAGDSYGTVSVTAAGSLTFVGNLADGIAVSQSVPVSKAGLWPLYSYAAGGKDMVLGWMSFGTNGSGFSGNVNWFKGAASGHYYPAGFGLQQGVFGERFTAAPNWTNAVLTLSGGNLSENLTNTLALVKRLNYSSASRSVTVSVNPATGGFSGTFVWPGTRRTTSMNGVILQSENSAGGFFLGTNASGAVLFQGQ